MAETQKRILTLSLTMTTEQKNRYEAEIEVLASRYDSQKVSDLQRLYVAERVLVDRPIEAKEAVALKPTKSALAAVDLCDVAQKGTT